MANHGVFALSRGEKTTVAKKPTFPLSRMQRANHEVFALSRGEKTTHGMELFL